MSGFFYNLGRMVGPKLRQANWVYQSLTGTEADAIRAESGLGRDLAKAFLQQFTLDDHPATVDLLDDLGARLTSCLRNRQRQFHYFAVQSVEINAFALPGGYIFLTRPLLDLCQGHRDELAFVLGHEMGHVIRLHAIDRLMANSVISTAAGTLSLGKGMLRQHLSGVVTMLLQQGYSQDQELDADRVGAEVAGSAGFDPAGAIRLLERLRALAPELTLFDRYFCSHPATDVRIRNLQGGCI
jgi:predicted Zn-dependent protease